MSRFFYFGNMSARKTKLLEICSILYNKAQMANNIYKLLMLLLLLVVLPLGSYIYLKKGYSYRKTIMKELSQHTPLKDTIRLNEGEILKFRNHCTVVDINGTNEDVKNIYLQFKEAKGFQLVSGNDPKEVKTVFAKVSEGNDQIFKESYKSIDSASLARLKVSYADKSFIIIDSLNNVRYQYGQSLDDKQRLVAHITSLLPYYDEKKAK